MKPAARHNEDADEIRLTAYAVDESALPIRPMPRRREWMDATLGAYAYRCLPLAIANTHGWDILCGASVEASWGGGAAPESLTVRPLEEAEERLLPVSHFGHGILTFHTSYLFRTDPGYNLWVMGPINRPRDKIYPLCGLIETDWSPYTFTMNWVFNRPGATVRFHKGEPICSFFLVPRGLVERASPEIRRLDSDPEAARDLEAWRQSRDAFIRDLAVEGTEANEKHWQKLYYTGYYPDGVRRAEDHQIKLHVRTFANAKP